LDSLSPRDPSGNRREGRRARYVQVQAAGLGLVFESVLRGTREAIFGVDRDAGNELKAKQGKFKPGLCTVPDASLHV
jgi:hypothetical protein